jgi:hypothetical protein
VTAPALSFAESVEGAPLLEARRELVREAAFWLGEFERHRRDEDRGRLLEALELLGFLVRAERVD